MRRAAWLCALAGTLWITGCTTPEIIFVTDASDASEITMTTGDGVDTHDAPPTDVGLDADAARMDAMPEADVASESHLDAIEHAMDAPSDIVDRSFDSAGEAVEMGSEATDVSMTSDLAETTDATDIQFDDVVDDDGAPACSAPMMLCSGACVDTQSDTSNCGQCGMPCPTGASCNAGTCMCPTPTMSCNGACIDYSGDPANCGGCGASCNPPANATPMCSGGMCSFVCNTGFMYCSTGSSPICADTRADPLNCGTCGNACPSPPNSTNTICNFGMCSFDCLPGFIHVAGGCDVAPPQLIAPFSMTSIDSNQPTFRWLLAGGTTAAFVDICSTPDCSTVLTTLNGSTTATPATALATGLYYWRARGFVSSSMSLGTTYTPIWEFRVGPGPRVLLDVNRDGFGDVFVGSVQVDGIEQCHVGGPAYGSVFGFLGAAGGLGTTAATQLSHDPYSCFGAAVASAGDINGDGFADLVVGEFNDLMSVGSISVYLGSPTGLGGSPAPTQTINGPDGNGGFFGWSVAGVGDMNGDGYGDVVASAIGTNGQVGTVYLFLGSATGLTSTPAIILPGPDGGGSQFGISIAAAGDVDGDSLADVVIGDRSGSYDVGPAGVLGHAWVYYGSASTNIDTSKTTSIYGSGGAFGSAVVGLGDINGDLLDDIAVASDEYSAFVDGSFIVNEGAVYVFTTSGGALSTSPAYTVTGPDGNTGNFGSSITAGDFNRDGYTDLVVGADGVSGQAGRAYIMMGTSSGFGTTMYLNAPSAALEFGSASAIDDVNGDGYGDLIIGAKLTAGGAGATYLYNGGCCGVGTGVDGGSPMPTAALNPGVASWSSFGISVASLDGSSDDGGRLRAVRATDRCVAVSAHTRLR